MEYEKVCERSVWSVETVVVPEVVGGERNSRQQRKKHHSDIAAGVRKNVRSGTVISRPEKVVGAGK